MTHPPEHFQGKSVPEHLKDARKKGALATAEVHGPELPGHLAAAYDSAKDTATALLVLWALSLSLLPGDPIVFPLLLCFGFGFVLWKAGRTALRGWSRLERLHKVIEEERWEIEHHRDQEREELAEMYAAKGFTGKLLDEVVDVLMADDNRLLQVMLEEELGLSLEVYEHPLKQCLGSFIGAFSTAALLLLAHFFWPLFGIPTLALLVIGHAASRGAKLEKRGQLTAVVWNFSLSVFATAATYFLAKYLI